MEHGYPDDAVRVDLHAGPVADPGMVDPRRERLQTDLRALFEALGLTVVHVTHDVGEAFALGDRVAILRDGRVAQVAPPDELWAQPADDWVARFLGMRNVAVDGASATVTRPEAVRLVPGDDEGGELEALATRVDHPRIGDRAGVQVDPDGIVRVPVFDPSAGDRCLRRARAVYPPPATRR